MAIDVSLLADVYSLLLADIRANRARREVQQRSAVIDECVDNQVTTYDSDFDSKLCVDSSVSDQYCE
jgi:hypothetical protein